MKDIIGIKKEIRIECLKKRNQLSISDRQLYNEAIKNIVCAYLKSYNPDAVLLYDNYQNEVETKSIFAEIRNCGIEVFYPVSNGQDYTMKFYKVDQLSDLVCGYKGIMEPGDLDVPFCISDFQRILVMVPGAAFDLSGDRIGYGKGFYDRFLADVKNQILSASLLKHPTVQCLGLCYECQIVDKVPADMNDVKLDLLITEKQLYRI